MSQFECIYEIDDGYVGKSAPQKFPIDSADIDEWMTDDDLIGMFQEYMQGDFVDFISPYEKNQDEFIKWAKNIIKNNIDR